MDITERLRILHVWPQSTASEYADVLGPRRVKALYEVGEVAYEAATEIETLRAALLAERERCAKIAEQITDQYAQDECGQEIAKAIRARPPMPYGEAVAYALSQGKRI